MRACDRRFCLGKQRVNPFAWESMPRNGRTEEKRRRREPNQPKPRGKRIEARGVSIVFAKGCQRKWKSIFLSIRIIPMHSFSYAKKNVLWVLQSSLPSKWNQLYSHPVPISRSCSQLSQKRKEFSPSLIRSQRRPSDVSRYVTQNPAHPKEEAQKPPLQHNHTRGLMHHVSIHSLCGKTLYVSFSLLLLLR